MVDGDTPQQLQQTIYRRNAEIARLHDAITAAWNYRDRLPEWVVDKLEEVGAENFSGGEVRAEG